MATFITLTLVGGRAIRVNMDGILSYERVGPLPSSSPRGAQPERTALISMKSEELFVDVVETPEQIDAMLGVTDNTLSLLTELVDGMSDVEDSHTRVLERSRKLIAKARGE